jgi:ribosomal protein S21
MGRKVQVEVTVDGDINKALYILRNKFNKEGLKNEITKNRFYEKPSGSCISPGGFFCFPIYLYSSLGGLKISRTFAGPSSETLAE